jgi:hypothetical protein
MIDCVGTIMLCYQHPSGNMYKFKKVGFKFVDFYVYTPKRKIKLNERFVKFDDAIEILTMLNSGLTWAEAMKFKKL